MFMPTCPKTFIYPLLQKRVMPFKKRVLLVFAIAVLFLYACAPLPQEPSQNAPSVEPEAPVTEPLPPIIEQPSPPVEEEPVAAEPEISGNPVQPLIGGPAPKEHRLDVSWFYAGTAINGDSKPSYDYLGGLTQILSYHNPEIDFSDVVAASGTGTSAYYDPARGLTNFWEEASVIHALKNLGYEYELGVGRLGPDLAMQSQDSNRDTERRTDLDFDNSAANIITFDSTERALNCIRTVIASGNPVLVHLDTIFVRDELRQSSRTWGLKHEPVHESHFFVVTGYDEVNIYLNDPSNPEPSGKDMWVPVGNFMQAWKEGSNDLIPGPKMGPYWMLRPLGRNAAKTPQEIVAWNKEISTDVAAQIKRGYPSDAEFYTEQVADIARGRQEFAKFLKKNGYMKAGDLYQQAADGYAALRAGQSDIYSTEAIAALEKQGLGELYK